jgi:hypothetical protein
MTTRSFIGSPYREPFGCGMIRMYGLGSHQSPKISFCLIVGDRAGDDHVLTLLPVQGRRKLMVCDAFEQHLDLLWGARTEYDFQRQVFASG